jgi:hypothetical protein
MDAKILPFENPHEQIEQLRKVQKVLVKHMLMLTDGLQEIANHCCHSEVKPDPDCLACKARVLLDNTV